MLVCARWLLNPTFRTPHSLSQFHWRIYQRSFIPAICTCNSFYHEKVPPILYDSKATRLLNPWINSFPLSQHPVIFYCQNAPEPEKLSLLQRFKQMYKDYWYVLVPVHLVTSASWFTLFYYLTKSGVDIAAILERIGAGEKLVEKLRNSNSTMGYIAVSYALYKIATPVRYTVTLGGTTVTIKYLRDWGYIKPIPPKDKIKEIIHEKKDILREKKENLKNRYKEKGFIERILLKTGLKKNREDKK